MSDPNAFDMTDAPPKWVGYALLVFALGAMAVLLAAGIWA
jgi:hypothetical protein